MTVSEFLGLPSCFGLVLLFFGGVLGLAGTQPELRFGLVGLAVVLGGAGCLLLLGRRRVRIDRGRRRVSTYFGLGGVGIAGWERPASDFRCVLVRRVVSHKEERGGKGKRRVWVFEARLEGPDGDPVAPVSRSRDESRARSVAEEVAHFLDLPLVERPN